MKLYIYISNYFNRCEFHRLIFPYIINKDLFDNTEIFIAVDSWSKSDIEKIKPDYVISHYLSTSQNLIDFCKENRIKTITDVDDWIFLNPLHRLQEVYTNEYIDKLICRIKDSWYISTTQKELANRIKYLNNNVVIFENAMDFSIGYKALFEKIQFGYVGGQFHDNDVKSLTGINKERFPVNIYGISDKTKETYYNYSKIFGINSELFKEKSPEKYLEFYKYHNISLAPLLNNVFNRCKSNLKVIESACFSMPVICSNVYPYNEIVLNGFNGFLCNDLSDWIKAMKFYIKNKHIAKIHGENNFKICSEKYDIKIINKKRKEFYERNRYN